MLFIKLTGGPFLQGQFFNLQSFGSLEHTLEFQTANECRTFGRNFGRMLCAKMKQRLLLVNALSGQNVS